MNNPLPKKHEDFIQWAKKISDEMKESSKGSLRIGHNKLAAIMAKQLPGVTSDFNINTLKSVLDSLSNQSLFNEATKASIKEDRDAVTPTKNNSGKSFKSTLYCEFLALTNREMVNYFTQLSDEQLHKALESDVGAYDFLEHDFDITNFFDDDINLNDDDYTIVSAALPLHDSERLNSAYKERVAHLKGKEYGYIQYKTVCFAFIDHMKDSLYCFLDTMSRIYTLLKGSSSKTLSYIFENPEKVKVWVLIAAKNWDESGKIEVIIHDAFCTLDWSQNKKAYTVTVRANLYGDGGILEMYELPESWNCYDTSVDLENASVTMHCDTIVEVMASSREEALRLGKEKAELLGAPEGIEVAIWFDESIDASLIVEDLYAPF